MHKLVQLSGISKKYGNKQVLSDISFSLNAGDILGYIGPNGAGKTTTMKIICNLCRTDTGSVYLGEEREKTRIGIVFDYNGLYSDLTARENLEFFLRLYQVPDKEKSVDRLLDMVQLSNVKNERVKTFSKGMARRLVLARAFIQEPDVLIMDEPFDGLDVESQYLIIRFLREWMTAGERGILFTSHNMKEIQSFCNRLVIIDQGKILSSGSVEELLQAHYKGLCIRLSSLADCDRLLRGLSGLYQDWEQQGEKIFIHTAIEKNEMIIQKIIEQNIRFREITEVTESLEEIYIKEVGRNEKRNC